MALRINDEAPNFTADTTEGTIDFHEWIGDGWAILFSHPKDFTPVCTTELGAVAGLKPEFDKRNCKVMGISVDGVSQHQEWSKDIEASQGHALNYPLVGDPELDGRMDFAGFMRSYSKYFGTEAQPNKPARSAIQIAALARPNVFVEVEVVLARP